MFSSDSSRIRSTNERQSAAVEQGNVYDLSETRFFVRRLTVLRPSLSFSVATVHGQKRPYIFPERTRKTILDRGVIVKRVLYRATVRIPPSVDPVRGQQDFPLSISRKIDSPFAGGSRATDRTNETLSMSEGRREERQGPGILVTCLFFVTRSLHATARP